MAVKSDSLVEVTVDTGTSHAGQPQEDIHQKLRPNCGWTIFTYIILFILLYIVFFNFGISNLKLCFECLSWTYESTFSIFCVYIFMPATKQFTPGGINKLL